MRRIRYSDVLLTASLIFNLVIVGFLVYHHFNRPQPISPLTELSIDRGEWRAKNREVVRCRNEFFTAKEAFISELQQPEFDADRLKQNLELTIEKQVELEKRIGENLIELRRDMTPEQADRFFQRIQHSMHRRKLPRRR